MKIRLVIINNKITEISFPKREGRNPTLKNWDPSKKQIVFLDLIKNYLNEKGVPILKFNGPSYIISDINFGKIDVNGKFDNLNIPEDIENLMDQEIKLRTNKENLDDLTADDIINIGLGNRLDL